MTKINGISARLRWVREDGVAPEGLGFSCHFTQHSASHPNSRPSASLRAGSSGANRGPRLRSVLG